MPDVAYKMFVLLGIVGAAGAAALGASADSVGVLAGADDPTCVPVSSEAAAAANLTDAERNLLSELCWHDLEPLLTTRSSIPPGVNCKPYTWCDKDNACTVVCERGTVEVEPWLANAMDAQNKLARRLPLCMATLLGSHNSGITMADGYGNLDLYFEQYLKWVKWAGGTHIQTNNQWLSITDQLNLGVRNVELDTHWVEGKLRIAHCGGAHVALFNHLIDAVNVVAKLLHAHIRWDTETFGCMPSLSSIPVGDQRRFLGMLQEIADWLQQPERSQEFLVLFLDDQPDLKTWGLVPLLLQEINSVFPIESIYTPPDHRAGNGSWPTMDELVARGKRVMFVSGADYGADMDPVIFSRDGEEVCDWQEPPMMALTGEPECTALLAEVGRTEAMESGTLLRTMTCELQYGPMNCDFVFHGINAPLLDEYSLPSLVGCGLNMPCPDLLTPDRAAAAVWSWAPGHPFAATATSSGDGAWGRLGEAVALSAAQGDEGLAAGLGGLRDALRRAMAAVARFFHRVVPHHADPAPSGGKDEALCVAISSADGRWRAMPCDGPALPSACRVAGGSSPTWQLHNGTRGSCPDGYSHQVPMHPKDNMQLMLAMQQQQVASSWLPIVGPDFAV